MRDKELQKLVDSAAKSNAAQAERVPRPAPSREPPPPNPVRLAVYARMHAGGPSILWFLPIAFVIGLAMFFDKPWFRYAALAYGIAFAIRIVVYVVGLMRGYAAFKRFPADLGVKLDGWYPMLDEKIIADPEEWQLTAELTVELTAAADRAPVTAALDLFVPKANSYFYTADSVFGAAGDVRVKWTRDELRVTGSLNVWVLGALYRLINQLDWIERRAGGLARVTVARSGGIYKHTRPSAD